MQYEELREQMRRILATGTYDSPGQAEVVAREYLAVAPTARDRGMALEALGQVLRMQGRLMESVETFTAADPLLSAPIDRFTFLNGFASVVVQGKMISVAESVAGKLRIVLDQHFDAVHTVAPWGYASLCHLALLSGDGIAALDAAHKAVAAAELEKAGRAEAYRALAEANEGVGNLEEALLALEHSMSFMSQGHCLLEARAKHAALLIRAGDTHSATSSLAYAVELPDLRDRYVLAKVLEIIAVLGEQDPVAAWRCTKTMAAHLNRSVSGLSWEGGGGGAQGSLDSGCSLNRGPRCDASSG